MVSSPRRSPRRKGAALVEYVTLIGLVSIIAIGAVHQLGQGTSRSFIAAKDSLSENIETAQNISSDSDASTEAPPEASGGDNAPAAQSLVWSSSEPLPDNFTYRTQGADIFYTIDVTSMISSFGESAEGLLYDIRVSEPGTFRNTSNSWPTNLVSQQINITGTQIISGGLERTLISAEGKGGDVDIGSVLAEAQYVRRNVPGGMRTIKIRRQHFCNTRPYVSCSRGPFSIDFRVYTE